MSNSFFFPFSVTFSIDGRSRDTHETPARPSRGARSGGGAGEDRHPGQTLWAGAGVSREATAGRRQRGAGKGERTGGPGEPRGRALVSLSLARAARGGDPHARAHLTQAGEAKGRGSTPPTGRRGGGGCWCRGRERAVGVQATPRDFDEVSTRPPFFSQPVHFLIPPEAPRPRTRAHSHPCSMAQDGCQPPAWSGQAFPFLPKLVAGAFFFFFFSGGRVGAGRAGAGFANPPPSHAPAARGPAGARPPLPPPTQACSSPLSSRARPPKNHHAQSRTPRMRQPPPASAAPPHRRPRRPAPAAPGPAPGTAPPRAVGGQPPRR